MMLKSLYQMIRKYSDPKRAQSCQRYFKTKPGQYAEGDKFLGLTNPQVRLIAKQFKQLKFQQIQQLLDSQFHQQRSVGLLILIQKFKKQNERKYIYEFYLKNLKSVNNWDLVDLSAPNIVGQYLYLHQQKQNRKILYELSQSSIIWQRRISIISTFTFIRKNQFHDAISISQILLTDKHDLIHKAVGWMLREIGKRDLKTLENFIHKNYFQIPRTTLRYSIEKFDQQKRKRYLKGQF